MFFSRVLISLFAVGFATAAAVPAAAPLKKREDISDVLAIVGQLRTSTNSILPQIDGLVNSGAANEQNLSPLLAQLSSALDTSAVSIESLEGKVDPSSGGTEQQVANQVGAIYTNVATSMNNIQTKKPHLYPLVPKHGIDAALIKLLLGLKLVLAGVIKLLSVVLFTVAGLLAGVGFLLKLLLLGLL
ncbi:hypothetical protein FA15DRAFT_739255 [Coprinopsis marcescibilis]|uniref:Sc15 protein n=1 Tax=Coprinopsis marcescibilis TaxID=230819 RepID=A0A5C3KAI1_COPMA|nr:hypothetical protein FA15DRAFT_739255 [Coprinopsis marcescibilis]